MIERYRKIQQERASGEREEGFTLIELLIVIVVLGILAAIVIFSLTGVTGTSAVAACNTDAKTVQTAVAAYQSANNGAGPGAVADTGGTGANSIVPTYLHSWPGQTGLYQIGVNASNQVTVITGSGSTAVTTPYDSQAAASGSGTSAVAATGCFAA